MIECSLTSSEVVSSGPVAVTQVLDTTLALSKAFVDLQVTSGEKSLNGSMWHEKSTVKYTIEINSHTTVSRSSCRFESMSIFICLYLNNYSNRTFIC